MPTFIHPHLPAVSDADLHAWQARLTPADIAGKAAMSVNTLSIWRYKGQPLGVENKLRLMPYYTQHTGVDVWRFDENGGALPLQGQPSLDPNKPDERRVGKYLLVAEGYYTRQLLRRDLITEPSGAKIDHWVDITWAWSRRTYARKKAEYLGRSKVQVRVSEQAKKSVKDAFDSKRFTDDVRSR